ncbi:phosphoglucomutase-2-like [Lingula anatina]|uniref:Phosphoglucomutase-2-like n=1 Tax=Lingula anatina TaxID=7574 RepID=A0A1S3J041_LINAN|nr:phosphoglucomutase-2-like [Lingula anatina]|eukprot:XP_013403616.1 phosphoglucomutase-2-like [Lingula anatina]
MSFSTGDSVLDSTLTDWLRWDQNPESKSFIEKLIESNNVDELRNRLLKRMEFGTAGLRAKMGAGNSMMNDLTIIQTSQGLAMYLVSSSPHVIEKGVMIGFDARHNSQRFAQLAAIAFLQKNIPVYLFSQICPTPFVPYATVKLGCVCGIMVTASHNPKEDNGYKVYWENGAQIISPHDKGISKSITENQEPWPEAWKTDSLDSNPLLKQPFEEIKSSYFQELQKICFFKELNPSSPLKFTYTAMHGVGYQFAVSAFEAFHFKPFTPVLEQIVPDPEFPTVKFPNPEEGKSALDYAMKTADENHSMVILANDPDADRLAVAEKQPSGEWHVFTGNELGALFGWWLWFTFKKANPTETGADVYMFASTVSSKILHSMSKKEGFNYEETLTGFKWMGNRSHTVIQEKKRVVFAFEEAIGFMCGSMVLDKDGVSAVAVCAEMATYLYHNNLTIMKQLDKIYEM